MERIVSGGQTGADRGGLDAAIELGIPHGGWCPKGRLAEDGTIPRRYRLRETELPDYGVRTARNVRESEATVVFTFGRPTGGSALTLQVARMARRTVLHVDLAKASPTKAARRLRVWCDAKDVRVLNVAGSRESGAPGMQHLVAGIVKAAFARR